MNWNKATIAAGREDLSKSGASDDKTPAHNPYQTLERAPAREVCP